MARFIEIGPDVFDLDSVTRISMLENRSGISDQLLIDVAGSCITIDSGIVGRNRMDSIRQRLMLLLEPKNLDVMPITAEAKAA